MSKACQYANNEAKIGVGVKEVSLKDARATIKKISPRIRSLRRVKLNGKRLTMKVACNT
jgi:hypothetical protein